ncbi:MAG: EAL domain-containing protein [Thermoanaerobaculia bacterium]|nr:EAL domain-containing protein [Thermoanaerobaculia bacterium]
MSHQPTVLIADDDRDSVRMLRSFLEALEVEILVVEDGHEALEIARDLVPDVLLLDVDMPGRSGWDVCQAIKGVRRTRDIMIVLMTGHGDVRDRLTGLQAGADDYVVKPFERNDVTWRVGRLLEISRERGRDGEAKEIEDELDDLMQDPATGLPAVSLTMASLREMLIENFSLGIMHVDVEQFEQIEEEFGWAFFDEFLRRSAEVIFAEASRLGGIAAVNRVGSSAFFIFLPRAEQGSFESFMERESDRLRHRLTGVLQNQFPGLASGEIAFFVGNAVIRYSPQIRLERQIYRGLQLASDVVRREERKRKQELVDEMREIIGSRNVTIVYQPIVAASDCTVFGYELLTRGPDSSSFRNSDMLFAFARENEMAWDLEKVAIESMVASLRQAELGNRRCLINLEAETMEAFAQNLDQMVDFFAESPERIVFELTERAWIEDYAAFRKVMETLKERGVGIAIDDAGSGYASLEAIASLQPDFLKITKGLVSTIGSEPIKQDLIRLLVELAEKIGALTIAEGIETSEEYEWCRKLGIDLLQGYYLARPSTELIEEVELPEGCEPLVKA